MASAAGGYDTPEDEANDVGQCFHDDNPQGAFALDRLIFKNSIE